MWEIGTAELGEDLAHREDPLQPDVHGFIEPRRSLSLDEFERALEATRGAWRLL